MDKRLIALRRRRHVPQPCSGVAQRLVRERSIDQLSPQACALSLFLVTGADAQGWSYYAEHPLSERVSMALTQLRQARQALSTHNLLAYRRPLYQVLALGEADGAPAAGPQAHDDEVDIKAVVARLWEVFA